MLSKCSLLVSIAESSEREQELRLRMIAVEEYCLTLEERVQCRVAEMMFELAQTVSNTVYVCICVNYAACAWRVCTVYGAFCMYS